MTKCHVDMKQTAYLEREFQSFHYMQRKGRGNPYFDLFPVPPACTIIPHNQARICCLLSTVYSRCMCRIKWPNVFAEIKVCIAVF